MLTATATNQQIVNARILAEMAVQFNIGADILGKGNRFIEKHLGAEKMSGDTVMVPVVDSGRVSKNLTCLAKISRCSVMLLLYLLARFLRRLRLTRKLSRFPSRIRLSWASVLLSSQ